MSVGRPCMCGGCAECLKDQGWEPCPDCGAFGGCDCAEEPPQEYDPMDRIGPDPEPEDE